MVCGGCGKDVLDPSAKAAEHPRIVKFSGSNAVWVREAGEVAP